jgi:anti-sigma factor RsiW
MISCQDFMAELGNYLDGEVAADVRAQIESHLGHCRTCQVVYDSSRKTVRILTDSGSFDLPDGAAKPIAEQVMNKIRNQRGRP